MKFRLLSSMVFAAALLCGPVQAQDARATMQSDLIEAVSATNAALGAQSAFNIARNANDVEAQKDAAELLLVETARTAFWSKLLHQAATEANATPQTMADILELNELSVRAFNALSPVVISGDMAALQQLLDEDATANTLTGLSTVLSRMVRTLATD